MDNPSKNKKVQFIIINRLGEFKLDPLEMLEEDIVRLLKWFKNSEMDNLTGTIDKWNFIFPSAVLKESVIKYSEIKE
jgi:hypothetical protein